uniref:Pentatricopeptide repeat-containing protein At2g22070 n=1 Tax=Anthurium amnicola TaxID=1678845 RepID=A0A1D1YC30_9ARAE
MMASLSPVTLSTTLHKHEPDHRKLPTPTSLLLDKRSHESRPERTPQCVHLEEALSLLKQGTRVESALYVPLLQECIDRSSLRGARSIHAHIFKTGAHQELFLSTFLVNVYAKCGSVKLARQLFDALPRRNIVAWTALMTGYVHSSQPEQAVQVFHHLLEAGAYPTNYTLGAILNACCALYCLELGRQVHAYIVKYNIGSDTSIGNSLCSFYSKCGSLDSAVQVFHNIPDKNVISWTTAVTACGDNGRAEMGLRFFLTMLLEGIDPNEFTLTAALSLCCEAQEFALGKQIQSLCIKFGCEPKRPVRNSIMYLYLKRGEIDNARRLFDDMGTVTLVTWNAMIAGHAQMMDLARDDVSAHRSGVDALKIFLKLNRSDMEPDLFSYSSILSVCSRLSALEHGEQVHAQTIKTGFLSDVVVGSALVNMYSKCGSIEKATKAFVEMPTRTMISWTSMVTAFSQHGQSNDALRLFEDMRLAGVRPNEITFVGVLSACSQAGMIVEAERYLKMMTKDYRIKPVMDHYGCMIDMYVRLGMLEEAFNFIKGMPFGPNEVIWSMLIAGCRSHGKMELAFQAADRLLELGPKSSETYFLLLNMYISAERWQDVSKVRKLMKQEKIGGVKDWSWVNLKEKLYYFGLDDRSHPQSAQMYELLGSLLEKAKHMGYISYESLEIVDDDVGEKEPHSLVHHSERLAIVFSLINTAEGMPVRIIKNISMCRDCHSLVKFFSALTQREIIVRDSKRLHRFREGKCSCGDFGAFL